MTVLAGKRVAFTGQLASMTRSEAAELVRAHDGIFVTAVTRNTAFLVIGQEGYPLRKDGGLSNKLEMAKNLQAEGCGIAIITEEELIQRLELEETTSGIRKQFTIAQLGRLLKVPRDRLKVWMRAGLLAPVQTVNGMCYFDFHQVTGVRTLWDLTQAGVKTETIKRSLEQLTRWLPDTECSLAHLNLIERDGRLLTRLNEGHLADSTGQMHLDFEDQGDDSQAVTSAASLNAEEWLAKGCAFEDAEQLKEAAEAYREALFTGGPDAQICFNLGNVLFRMDQFGQAAERFHQAVELDHNFMEAWNNLGNTLLELGQVDEGLNAFYRALEINPNYADAHYNLADAFEQVDRFSEARRHWKDYLKHEPMGEWADYARRRLAN